MIPLPALRIPPELVRSLHPVAMESEVDIRTVVRVPWLCVSFILEPLGPLWLSPAESLLV